MSSNSNKEIIDSEKGNSLNTATMSTKAGNRYETTTLLKSISFDYDLASV
jgi:hypothetical protein